MSEKFKDYEAFLSKAFILEIFYQLIGDGERIEERRICEDEKGLYLIEVRSTVPDADGYFVELTYMREGTYTEGSSLQTRIDVVYYTTDGVAVGGRPVQIFKNGQWKQVD